MVWGRRGPHNLRVIVGNRYVQRSPASLREERDRAESA